MSATTRLRRDLQAAARNFVRSRRLAGDTAAGVGVGAGKALGAASPASASAPAPSPAPAPAPPATRTVAPSPPASLPTVVATSRPAWPSTGPATPSPGTPPASSTPSAEIAPVATGAAPAGRLALAWWRAVPWLTGAVLALALYFAWHTYDLLENRLHESGTRFNATMQRFERYWALYDATMESALALKWDLSSPQGVPDARAFEAEARRFEQSSRALDAEITRPGILMLSQAGAYEAAAVRLVDALARIDRTDDGGGRFVGPARALSQAVLERLAQLGQEARQRQAQAASFRDEVDDVRRQLLLAFSGFVAMLALVVAVAVRGARVARRERASRARAEHLAEVAEAERSRAENVARDKSRFLGMLSHELLTPLQSIWSTIDVIEARGRVDVHDTAFVRLKDSTRSLRARISDLVDFAKMSSGRLETRIRGFHLDKLIDTALRQQEEVLAARNLDVHWEAGPELAERIYSDPGRLRQVVDNLLSNAIKYTERGGITITAQVDRAAGVLKVEIADTGAGIRPEDLARLFEPFYRSPATAAMAEGSGLGLTVVNSLVDLMGGSVRIDSRVGEGTTALLSVPIAEAPGAAPDVPLRIDDRRPVLVVDDSGDARRALADVLRALGLEVHEAASGLGGLAAADGHDYQAILLDLQMPDLSGLDVARRLREPGHRHEKTFLVLVSAFGGLEDVTASGVFDARIDKPASRKDLLAALARASHRGAG